MEAQDKCPKYILYNAGPQICREGEDIFTLLGNMRNTKHEDSQIYTLYVYVCDDPPRDAMRNRYMEHVCGGMPFSKYIRLAPGK